MTSDIGPTPSDETVIFEAPNGDVRLDVRLEADTVWLTQAQMADHFGRERSVITKHLRNVYAEDELVAVGTSAKRAQVQMEGGRTVALALLVAESDPSHKQLVIRVILNLLEDDPA